MEDRNFDGPSNTTSGPGATEADLFHELRQLSRGQLEQVAKFAGSMKLGAGGERLQNASPGPLFVPGLTEENVEQAFQYHPWDLEQRRAGAIIVEALVAAAKAALRNVPAGPDRSAGLRKLREARMDFNSAITHRGRF